MQGQPTCAERRSHLQAAIDGLESQFLLVDGIVDDLFKRLGLPEAPQPAVAEKKSEPTVMMLVMAPAAKIAEIAQSLEECHERLMQIRDAIAEI